MDWRIALVASAIVFGAFIVFKVRPVLSATRRRGEMRQALKQARGRIEAAQGAEDKARALADAADACAAIRRPAEAASYFARAMRTDPTSSGIVERAAKALEPYPYPLEALLWRKLGASPWTGDTRESVECALAHLAKVYAGPMHDGARARAIDRALISLGAEPAAYASVAALDAADRASLPPSRAEPGQENEGSSAPSPEGDAAPSDGAVPDEPADRVDVADGGDPSAR